MYVAVAVWALALAGVTSGRVEALAMTAGEVVLAFLFFWILDRNRVVGGPPTAAVRLEARPGGRGVR